MHNLAKKSQGRVDKACANANFPQKNWPLQLKQGYHQNFNISLFIITLLRLVTM
jgi:hypothetical protein